MSRSQPHHPSWYASHRSKINSTSGGEAEALPLFIYATTSINGEDFEVVAGDCITIEAKELHSQTNPFSEKVEWLYFGIATD